jgi:hypothetical protein
MLLLTTSADARSVREDVMIVERDASEEEMILEFLKAECGRPLIDDADLSDAAQNAQRAKMLDARRGYLSRQSIFTNFPSDVHWKSLKLTSQDFPHLRYVNSSPWRPLAGEALRVTDGASRIVESTFDFAIPNIDLVVAKIQSIARSIREGRDVGPALILADIGDGKMVLLEGNHRATAYVIANVGKPIPALSGSSPDMIAWAAQIWR